MKFFILLSVFMSQAFAQEQNGLTWGVNQHLNGHVNVGCHGGPATGLNPKCNAYQGDTSCSEIRPVLCINKSIALVQPSLPYDQYNQWAAGEVRLTKPILGIQLNSLMAANSLCAEYFGAGWRMAEFHDGWGWGFWAKGNISSDERFWVYINDQRANCWDGEPQQRPKSLPSGPVNNAPVEYEEIPEIQRKPIEPGILVPNAIY
jgi:hypothetical protein